MPGETGPPPGGWTEAVRRSTAPYLPLIFGIIALAMVVGSLWNPWYSYNLRDGPNYAGVVKTSYSNLNLFGEHGYAAEYDRESSTAWEDAAGDDNTARLFIHLRPLVIAGAMLAGGAVAGSTLAIWKGKRGIATALALVLAAWCLFTPLFFMANLDPARQADDPYGDAVNSFWGQSDSADAEIGAPDNIHHRIYTWGPGIGWYMSLVAGIISALAVAALLVPVPRPTFAELRLPVVVAVLMAVCLIGPAVALYPAPVEREPPGDGPIAARAEALPNGDWSIGIVSGYKRVGEVVIQVVNPADGSALVNGRLSAGTAGNPDFLLNDTNGNNRLDAGDSILLRGTVNGQPNPRIQEGFKVQFLRGDTVIGTIKELPPH